MQPTRIVLLGFICAIIVGTGLLYLPAATTAHQSAPLLTAFFTAVSAVCVTGLAIVDTGTYWSFFGQAVIMLLFQIGGFGIMTVATLLGLMINRSLRLKTRLIAQTETRNLSAGDLRSIVRLIFTLTMITEGLIAATLFLNFKFRYDQGLFEALWNGVFHAASAFNNAGFALYDNGLMPFSSDLLMLTAIMLAILIGGIGFPVLFDLKQRLSNKLHLSLHSKITLAGSAILLVAGTVLILMFEWDNPATLGAMDTADKVLNAVFASVSSRTAGFNAVDIGAMEKETWSVHFLLMFVGGGSAGTAGGVKVGTFFILLLLVTAEIQGRRDVTAFGRRISSQVQREAITVLVLGSAVVVAGTWIVLASTDFPTGQVIFEVVSAFGTVGLSTGITANLPPVAQITLTILMLVGRVGTITVAAALAMKGIKIGFRYPEERPIVG